MGRIVRYLEQRLKLRHLRVVDAIVEGKSLLKASEILGISQPALSRALRDIEAIVGGPIVERHARGVRANEIGLVLADGARSLLLTLRRMESDLAGLSDTRKRTIRVGVSPISALGLMPAVIANTTSQEARLHITLIEGRTDQLIPALVQGDVDVVVGRIYDPPAPDGLTRTILYNEPLSIIAAADHPLSRIARPGPEAVALYPMILPPIGSPLEREVERMLDTLALIPQQMVHSTSMGLTRELLLAGRFVTMMPTILVASDVARGTLRALPVKLPPLGRPAGLTYADDLGLAGTLMLAELSREIKRLIDEGILDLPHPSSKPERGV